MNKFVVNTTQGSEVLRQTGPSHCYGQFVMDVKKAPILTPLAMSHKGALDLVLSRDLVLGGG